RVIDAERTAADKTWKRAGRRRLSVGEGVPSEQVVLRADPVIEPDIVLVDVGLARYLHEVVSRQGGGAAKVGGGDQRGSRRGGFIDLRRRDAGAGERSADHGTGRADAAGGGIEDRGVQQREIAAAKRQWRNGLNTAAGGSTLARALVIDKEECLVADNAAAE